MAKSILICPKCHTYTLKDTHCDTKTITVKPAKFSPEKEEKYSKYRVRYKNVLENR